MTADPICDSSRPRQLPVTGGHNLRDLGGYKTSDGRQVKWGVLFRSGAVYRLTEDDVAYMRKLGIVSICDLRTPHERARKPMTWHEGEPVEYFGAEADISVGDLERIINSGNLPPGTIGAVIRNIYRRLPFEQAKSYRQLFHMLSQGRLPLLFNCSAGKDRTGLAAALVLTALGVKRDVIEHDYALTNGVIEKLEHMMLHDARYAGLHTVTRDEYLPLLTADPSYLSIAFTEIERECGSIAAYLENQLGAGPAEIEAMKNFLLE